VRVYLDEVSLDEGLSRLQCRSMELAVRYELYEACFNLTRNG
jgi:hypothetical protein